MVRTFKENVGQVARWIEQMAEYDFDIVHKPGKQQANADVTFRYPVTVSAISDNKKRSNPAFKNDFKKKQGIDTLPVT